MSQAEIVLTSVFTQKALGIVREYSAEATSATPIDELGIDSLEYLALIVDLESAFETKLDDSRLQHIDTVHDLISAISG